MEPTAAQTPLPPPLSAPLAPAATMERLDRRLVPYWMLANVISTAVLVAILAVGVAYLGDRFPVHFPWMRRVAVGCGGGLLLLSLVQPALAWMTWCYAIDDQLLTARYGILFREEKVIPISRLQHVDLRRGPIERLFSLATLVVFTAGTEAAAFRVPGLTVERARAMRDRILQHRGDDVV